MQYIFTGQHTIDVREESKLAYAYLKASVKEDLSLWSALSKMMGELEARKMRHSVWLEDSSFVFEFEYDRDGRESIVAEEVIIQVFENLSRVPVKTYRNGSTIKVKMPLCAS